VIKITINIMVSFDRAGEHTKKEGKFKSCEFPTQKTNGKIGKRRR
jgi:hypothetical protein